MTIRSNGNTNPIRVSVNADQPFWGLTANETLITEAAEALPNNEAQSVSGETNRLQQDTLAYETNSNPTAADAVSLTDEYEQAFQDVDRYEINAGQNPVNMITLANLAANPNVAQGSGSDSVSHIVMGNVPLGGSNGVLASDRSWINDQITDPSSGYPSETTEQLMLQAENGGSPNDGNYNLGEGMTGYAGQENTTGMTGFFGMLGADGLPPEPLLQQGQTGFNGLSLNPGTSDSSALNGALGGANSNSY